MVSCHLPRQVYTTETKKINYRSIVELSTVSARVDKHYYIWWEFTVIELLVDTCMSQRRLKYFYLAALSVDRIFWRLSIRSRHLPVLSLNFAPVLPGSAFANYPLSFGLTFGRRGRVRYPSALSQPPEMSSSELAFELSTMAILKNHTVIRVTILERFQEVRIWTCRYWSWACADALHYARRPFGNIQIFTMSHPILPCQSSWSYFTFAPMIFLCEDTTRS